MLASEKLRRELARYKALRQHADPVFRRHLHRLQAFQARRLKHTHAALLADPASRPAAEFFLSDIYGGIDLLPMAQEIDRALPLAVKLLPDTVFTTSALAVELMTTLQDLDEELATLLVNEHADDPYTLPTYLNAFRRHARYEQRRQVMTLSSELGRGLDRYVRSRIILATFRMVSGPAHRYGLGNLYDFLGRSFEVMRPLGSTRDLFEGMAREESIILDRIAAGDADPFLLRGKTP